MLFNTVDFAIFMPIIFLLYWFAFHKTIRIQNLFLIITSYFFYACWDWRFLGLIFFSSLVDYSMGRFISKSLKPAIRKLGLYISLTVNLGVLGFFKYYDFFIESFQNTFKIFGNDLNATTLNILLPVGISFYTFQTLSYTIDVYRKKMNATKNSVAFFAFVSFFPQLVAGPIERATHFLPQFLKKRQFSYNQGVDGLKLILIGLFKKMVIADNCAYIVDEIFTNYSDHSGSTLFFGAFFFAFQIYGDFSGYTDIAIGSAKLLGFDLMKNFNMPYLSRNLGEFWRRWHISLSTWFRDYVYIPLGGNRGSKIYIIRNIFIVFMVSGLWHGANWTFVFWGFIHALCFIPLVFLKNNSNYQVTADAGYIFPRLKTCIHIVSTFLIVVLAWVFFRADNLYHAFKYLQGIFNSSIFTIPDVPKSSIIFLILYMFLEWSQRGENHLLELKTIQPKALRIAIYYLIVFSVFYFAADSQPFIYFQF